MSQEYNPFLITDTDSTGDRSFIDLSFRGVAMSELGCTVVFDGDNQVDNLTPQFSNSTSNITGRDGMLYWGTSTTNLTLQRKIATDCMTARQFRKLKNLLTPGKVGRIYLSERPYCYAYGVLSDMPEFEFVPFDKTITINGEEYIDVQYRGSCTLKWDLLDAHWYGDDNIRFIKNYKKQTWIFESGLPYDSNVWHYCCNLTGDTLGGTGNFTLGTSTLCGLTFEEAIIVGNDGYTLAYDPAKTYVYNAGNVDSSCSLIFDYPVGTYTIENNKVKWTDIKINSNNKTTVITLPRVFSDIDYFESVFASISDSEYATNKADVLQDLRENLDSTSEWRDALIYQAQATGSGLLYSSISTMLNAVKMMVDNVQTQFTINSESHEMVMEISCAYVPDTFNNGNYTLLQTVENVEGVSNGQYITIGGNTSTEYSFDVSSSNADLITIAPTPSKTLVHFLNEYV